MDNRHICHINPILADVWEVRWLAGAGLIYPSLSSSGVFIQSSPNLAVLVDRGFLYSLPEINIFCYSVMKNIIPVPKMYDAAFEMVAFAENTQLSWFIKPQRVVIFSYLQILKWMDPLDLSCSKVQKNGIICQNWVMWTNKKAYLGSYLVIFCCFVAISIGRNFWGAKFLEIDYTWKGKVSLWALQLW